MEQLAELVVTNDFEFSSYYYCEVARRLTGPVHGYAVPNLVSSASGNFLALPHTKRHRPSISGPEIRKLIRMVFNLTSISIFPFEEYCVTPGNVIRLAIHP